jgi:hypothetical protein
MFEAVNGRSPPASWPPVLVSSPPLPAAPPLAEPPFPELPLSLAPPPLGSELPLASPPAPFGLSLLDPEPQATAREVPSSSAEYPNFQLLIVYFPSK